ncbi:hypothetical protein PCANC_15633 [Puccinia coronata f. sp. avenae]|uniref:Uncharacterized protein n=1 Tax=Puccinia coronata f. sp. avenae TaxID=200324 RepID=A0A2N5SF79_9BASI|nr:hypothetical protein PCANC_15633 [Puccinia coronata f. sp. avenae]
MFDRWSDGHCLTEARANWSDRFVQPVPAGPVQPVPGTDWTGLSDPPAGALVGQCLSDHRSNTAVQAPVKHGCSSTGQTRLFKHRLNCRVQPVNAGSDVHYTAGQVGRPFFAPVKCLGLGKWEPSMPQNIEAACGSNPHQKHQAAGLGTTAGFLLTHFARNELGSNAAIGAPLLCPCTDTETEDGPGVELLPTPGRSYVAPSRPVAALGRYQAACARSSLGPACDDSGYRRITVAHLFRPGDPWRRRGGMGTGSGTVSQVAPLPGVAAAPAGWGGT